MSRGIMGVLIMSILISYPPRVNARHARTKGAVVEVLYGCMFECTMRAGWTKHSLGSGMHFRQSTKLRLPSNTAMANLLGHTAMPIAHRPQK